MSISIWRKLLGSKQCENTSLKNLLRKYFIAFNLKAYVIWNLGNRERETDELTARQNIVGRYNQVGRLSREDYLVHPPARETLAGWNLVVKEVDMRYFVLK